MTTARRVTGWMLALAALAAGCGGSLGTPPCANGSCGNQTSTKATVQYNVGRIVDLLFVVDDTPAIAPYADRLASGFADMAAQLQNSGLGMSLHVGFVRAGSCDASTRAPACGLAAGMQFLQASTCGPKSNGSLPFTDAFACLGAFGAGDCAPSQPLAAAAQTLDPANPLWRDFLRPEAYLMLVIVAAGDDASGPPGAPTPVKDFVHRLHALKADPSQVLVSVVGPGDCAAGDVQGPRLLQLANEFGANGLYMNLCDDPLSVAVDRITTRSTVGLAPPCLTNVRDTDVATPGVQATCTLIERDKSADGSRIVEHEIPSCDTSASPCWRLRDGVCGDGSPGRVFNVEEAPDQCVDGSISLTVECLACADPNDPACALPQAQ